MFNRKQKKRNGLTTLPDEEVILLDTMNEDELLKIGDWLNAQQEKHGQLFSVGGSGIEMALGNYWNKKGKLKPMTKWKKIKKAEPLLVVSGSCSPVTKKQIEFALAHGFVEKPLEMETFQARQDMVFQLEVALKKLYQLSGKIKALLVHTGNIRKIEQSTSARTLGNVLGHIAKRVCEEVKLKRVVIAGGDTSSYAARAMGIDAVEMIAPLVIGAPLCKAYSKNKAIDGLGSEL
jgi:uncharacterized protein YgbK (DUF1537 family)